MNKVILIGRVGNDPELNTTTSGTPVAKFRLATSERYKDRNGEAHDVTEWHTVRCWRNTATFVATYCKSGTLTQIEGKLRTETWEKDGRKYSQTIIECEDAQLLARKNEGKPSASQNEEFEPKTDDLPF